MNNREQRKPESKSGVNKHQDVNNWGGSRERLARESTGEKAESDWRGNRLLDRHLIAQVWRKMTTFEAETRRSTGIEWTCVYAMYIHRYIEIIRRQLGRIGAQ